MGLLDDLERVFVRFFARKLSVDEDDLRDRAGVPRKGPKKPPTRKRTQTKRTKPPKSSQDPPRKRKQTPPPPPPPPPPPRVPNYQGKLIMALGVLGMPSWRDYDDPVETRTLIKAARKAKAKLYHPDLHPGDVAAEAKMKEVNAAVDFLLGALNDDKRNSR